MRDKSRLSSPALPRLPFPLPSQAHSRQRRGCGDSGPPSSATGSGAPKSHQTVRPVIFYIDSLLVGAGFFVFCGINPAYPPPPCRCVRRNSLHFASAIGKSFVTAPSFFLFPTEPTSLGLAGVPICRSRFPRRLTRANGAAAEISGHLQTRCHK